MTLASPISSDRNRLLDQRPLVIHDVSWSFYEDLLAQIENRPLRVTFDHGRLEIMAPLAEHEFPKGGMRRFDPAIYPPPDLAIEVDITSRSVPREPIYAALGVPELWQFDGYALRVLLLDSGKYRVVARSAAFPFLPMEQFSAFVRRMMDEEQTAVVREFRVWVRTLRTQ